MKILLRLMRRLLRLTIGATLPLLMVAIITAFLWWPLALLAGTTHDKALDRWVDYYIDNDFL
jgi:hypothetical protein